MIHLDLLLSAQLVRLRFVAPGPSRAINRSAFFKVKALSHLRFARIAAFDRVLRLSQASTQPPQPLLVSAIT
jgi:hypothetical protein